jgi:hypothetical protein
MPRRSIELIVSAQLLFAACGPATHAPPPAPERVVAVNNDGSVVRQSTSYENAITAFAASIDRVWPALQLSYADLGITPTIAERTSGRYGNEGFIAPRRILDRPLAEFFHCGAGLGGPLIDQGRLNVYMVTTLLPSDGGSTNATTYVTARLIRNEGTSGEPIRCGSTGKLEEALRTGIEQRIATKP